MRNWIRMPAVFLALASVPTWVACEGDMGGAEEHVQERPSEEQLEVSERSGQQTTAGGGTVAQTEGTSAQGGRLGP